ncbi:MAG: SPOR domain-containing protein [Pyrinomonadaceae bacterium]
MSKADARVRRVGGYDGYAVGRRVLKFVPAWFLLCVACFVFVLLLFKWAARPVGNAGAREEEFRNEATNRPPPRSPPDSHANAKPSGRTREDAVRGAEPSEPETGDAPATEAGVQRAGDAQSVSEAEEIASYSVQAGAFDDRSQANELVSRLRAAGFDARVVEAEDSRRFRFQVRSGLFHTREEAARLAAQLRPKGFGQTVIIEPAKP